MCVPPQTAMIIGSVASGVMQYQTAKAQAKANYAQQKRQNEIARKNAIQRYASEQLRIRQSLKKSSEEDLKGTLKARRARAEFTARASDEGGIAMSGSTNALLANYYRTEGNFRNAINNNMKLNVSQFERNLEAIQFGQESQSTYETPPNSALLFASSALNVANTYYSHEADKEMRGLKTNRDKFGYKK
jgi:hypothetical protein